MTTPIPTEPSFTAPHPVDQTEVTFDMSKRRKGVCKFFNSQKGFGFINDEHPDELGNQEVFVHYTSIGGKGGFRSLAEGEEVEYVVSPGQKGFQATEVTGPAGRAVQGDVKSKLPKTPTFVPYPMGVMPATYAIGAASPYIQGEPYMSPHPGSVYAGSPYASQVFYLPSPVGVLPAGHSSSLGQMSPYPAVQSPHTNMRSPTVPFTQNQHGQMTMALSPQNATGFGFGSPSMAYSFGTAGSNVLGHSTGSAAGADMRSPVIGFNAAGTATGFPPPAQSGFGTTNAGLGLRADTGTGTDSSARREDRRGSHSGTVNGGGSGLNGYPNSGSLMYSSGAQGTF
ncbi:hypothetical protein CROQUDRAFT_345771 [Cronartium quercuum f. sp. fusiforme G11]|uniref:CSD domain-containing protein n=1 Tax=Cronartium quercuum f. sp. fusiforme G11 TaxID=708437 RepID=A0A9P6N6Q2_9BASI|nr:hypothetical protein CROQUDRAFT_345771 [Cronartium quercuum f. sp. fusiforme G11]